MEILWNFFGIQNKIFEYCRKSYDFYHIVCSLAFFSTFLRSVADAATLWKGHNYWNYLVFILYKNIPAPPSPLIGSDGEHSQHSMSLPGQVW